MIGGIGHDVQKIKIRLEELQRDVSHFRSPTPSRNGVAFSLMSLANIGMVEQQS
jgi:hypothetical protein